MKFKALILCVICIAAVTVLCMLLDLRRQGKPSPQTLGDLLSLIQNGQGDALSPAKAAAQRDWAGNLPLLARTLDHEDWRLRVAACEILAASERQEVLPLLLPRASDTDWRVRAAAFEGLGRLHDAGLQTPLKDTPLDERESLLLGWLSHHDADEALPLAGLICEAYANAKHVELGRPLTQRCLTCHAGAEPEAFQSNARCQQCHADVYGDWAGSAHANSLSHLHLTTVDPATRTPGPVDFGQVRGIGCTQCHRLGLPVSGGPVAAQTSSQRAGCRFTFDPAAPAGDSCAPCHDATYRQWQTWKSIPHPRRQDWPPGQIELQARGDDRTCIDCHMTPKATAEGQRPSRDHRWAARRDVRFLREGIDVAWPSGRFQDGKGQAHLTLTNLTGHAYPTGGWRRALCVLVSPGNGGALQTVLCLSPRRPGLESFGAGPLLPAEVRIVPLAPQAGNGPLKYLLRYYRNLPDPGAYTVDVLTAEVYGGGYLPNAKD